MLLNYLPVYLIILSFLSITPFVEELQKYNKFFLVNVFVLAFFLLCLRDPMASIDAISYSVMFSILESADQIVNIYHGNYFFSLLMYLGNVIGLNYAEFEIYLSILCLILILKAIYIFFDGGRLTILAFVFFVISSTFVLLFSNVIRQGLSFSLLILSLATSYKEKNISILYFLLSCLSHWSAIVFFPLVLTIRMNLYVVVRSNLQYLVFLLPLSALLGYVLLNIAPSDLGVIVKLEAMNVLEYDNNIVYIKCFLLAVPFFISSLMIRNVRDSRLSSFLFVVYFYFLLIPVSTIFSSLLLSSRYLYYCSGFSSIYIAYLFSQIEANSKVKVYSAFFSVLLYGFFVFSFPSIIEQLGVDSAVINF